MSKGRSAIDLTTMRLPRGGRAAAREAGQLLTPWDFDPASVKQKVMIWHGANDNRIPAEAAGALASLIRRREA